MSGGALSFGSLVPRSAIRNSSQLAPQASQWSANSFTACCRHTVPPAVGPLSQRLCRRVRCFSSCTPSIPVPPRAPPPSLAPTDHSIRSHVGLPPRQPRAARVAVRPQYVLGPRQADGWHNRSEVREPPSSTRGIIKDGRRWEKEDGLCSRRSKQPFFVRFFWSTRLVFGSLGRGRKEGKKNPCLLTQTLSVHPIRRTLFVGKQGLERAKNAIVAYKTGQVKEMTPDIWQAKKIVDSTLHPGKEERTPPE